MIESNGEPVTKIRNLFITNKNTPKRGVFLYTSDESIVAAKGVEQC